VNGRSIVVLVAGSIFTAPAQDLPSTVRQGDTIHVRAPSTAVSARMGITTIRLFPDGSKPDSAKSMGLMPVEVNQTPGPQDLEIFDKSGQVIRKTTIVVEHVDFPTQNIVIAPSKKRVPPSPGEMETVSALRKALTEERFWSEPFVRPTDDCQNSPFGVRRLHNGSPTGNYHRGIDQRSRRGAPVRAIADGAVKIVRMWNIHGGTVGIDHGQGMASFYLHLSKFKAQEGARVRRGEVIGYVGATGFATGPHLHWQMTVHGVPVNPHQWVRGIGPCLERPAAAKRPIKRRKSRQPASRR
jgi:murein DD-endopeptidase MepM/ murein hydrolase activator NlpD